MTAIGLPARLTYAVLALPLGGAAGFYPAVFFSTKYAPLLSDEYLGTEGYGIFKAALAVGSIVGFTLALVVLTLPRVRSRKRRGRPARAIVTAIFILIVTLSFAGGGHSLASDLAIPAWLSVAMSFTFVRYGVLDQARRRAVRASTA